jgi:hypothetical protein
MLSIRLTVVTVEGGGCCFLCKSVWEVKTNRVCMANAIHSELGVVKNFHQKKTFNNFMEPNPP